MNVNSSSRGALPPLFDRIQKDSQGKQMLTPEEVKASIIAELSLILNTRCVVRRAIYEEHAETIPFFGLPDFFGLEDLGEFNGNNSSDWPKIARFIEITIEEAEPRLEDIHVTIEKFDDFSQTLSLAVSASVKKVEELKNIQFPLTLSSKNFTSP